MTLIDPVVAPTPEDILADPSQPGWIKIAVESLMKEDPVVALDLSSELHNVMTRRLIDETQANDDD